MIWIILVQEIQKRFFHGKSSKEVDKNLEEGTIIADYERIIRTKVLYDKKNRPFTMSGKIDAYIKHKDSFSVIDFKTSTKEKKEEWVENYFIQTSAYCEMYEELYGQPIDQIVILIVTEEGATQTFVKNKKDYLPLLKPAIEEFHRKFKNEK